MNITEFLLARIAEDEAVARGAHYEGQCWVPEEEAVVAADRDLDPVLFLDRKCDATHAANWSPARVLAECEAKRRIVEMHEAWPVLRQTQPVIEPATADPNTFAFRATQQLQWHTEQEYRAKFGDEPPTAPMLAALAAVYADHEDFQEEWRV